MKEAYYFSHDSNAHRDEKILMMRAEHGWEGYGIYWALIEMMFESADTALHHDKTKGVALNYNIDITLLNSVITTCIENELFESNDVVFWSNSLIKRKEKLLESRRNKSEAGKKGMAKRWGSKDENDNNVITEDNGVITKDNKVKESKVKEINILRGRYSDSQQEIIKRYFDAIRTTRKTGKISPAIILNEMKYWEKYETENVIHALETHIQKCPEKREEYTRGIIRRVTEEGIKPLNVTPFRQRGEPARPNAAAYKPFDMEKALSNGDY